LWKTCAFLYIERTVGFAALYKQINRNREPYDPVCPHLYREQEVRQACLKKGQRFPVSTKAKKTDKPRSGGRRGDLTLYKGLAKDASKKCQKNSKKVLTKRERDGIIAKLSRETAALRKTA